MEVTEHTEYQHSRSDLRQLLVFYIPELSD